MSDAKDKLIKLVNTSSKIIEAQKEASKKIEEERIKSIQEGTAQSSPNAEQPRSG